MEEKKETLLQKIFKLADKVDVIKKEQSGDGIKYKYVNEAQILMEIKATMREQRLMLIPSVDKGTAKTRDLDYTNSKGNEKKEVITTADMTYTWIDVDTDERLPVEWAMFGQNASASQAFGSGLTYTNKYFLLKFFNIATTEDDPDKMIQEQELKEERARISSLQTKIKKNYEALIRIHRTKDNLLKVLGYDYDEFLKKFNDVTKQQALAEQLETLLKGSDKK